MSIDEIETVNDRSPGMPLMLKTSEALRLAYPELSASKRKELTQAVVEWNAVGLGGEGEVIFKKSLDAIVELVAPELRGKPLAPPRDPMEKRARIDAVVEERKAQDKTLQSGSRRAKARLAMIREGAMDKLGKGNL
jgi:hypothetical protein